MAVKLKPFPSLLEYPTRKAFLAENPNYPCSPSAYSRELKRQRLEYEAKGQLKSAVQRSIIQDIVNEVKADDVVKRDAEIENMVALASSQNLPIKSIMPLPAAVEITRASIQSIKRHMVTQWQAAAWWLERVHPEIFAKKDAPASTANVIGIRLEIAHRTRSLSKKDDITRLSVSNVKEIKSIDNVSRDASA